MAAGPRARGTRRSGAAPGAGRGGLTLLELVLVMGLLALLLGSGVGFFAGLDLGRAQAPGLVRNVLRAAHDAALARRAPARVRLDRERGTLTAEALQVVGTWHFEGGSLRGAFGLTGRLENARFDDRGWIGEALAFDGQPGAFASFAVDHDSAWDAERGFAIECAVRRDTPGGGRLLALGQALEVLVSPRGAVRARFRERPNRLGPEGAGLGGGGSVLVESGPGALPLERWTRLAIEYDRARFTLAVDGVPVAAVEAEVAVLPIEGELVLSDPQHPFPGAVDALVVSFFEELAPTRLPDTVALAAEAPKEVRFDASGGLDRRHHDGPVEIPLELADGSRTSVFVGLFGTVE